jgi:uncharacterized membrane protein
MKSYDIKYILQHPAIALTAFAIVIIFGIFLRFHSLGLQSIWDDEAFTVQNITSAWRAAAYQPVNNHPPFYFAQLRLWRHLRQIEPHSLSGLSFLRANAAFWGSLSLILFYFLARRYFDTWLALSGTAIMALSPLHLAYSQDARPYTLALTLGLAGFLLIDWIARTDSRIRIVSWFALGVLWALELYTHYWGIFVVAGQMVFGVLSAQNNRRRVNLALTFVCAMIVFGAWWPVLNFHLHEKNSTTLNLLVPRLADLGKTFAAFSGFQFQFGHQTFIHPWPLWLVTTGIVLTLGIFLLGFLRGPRLAQVWLVIGIGVPFLISYWQPIFLWYRYPFLSYGAFVLLVISGLSKVPSRILRTLFIFFILSAEATACFQYFNGWQKGNAKSAVDYVHSLQTETSILVRPKYFGDVMSYYDNTPPARVTDEDSLDSSEKRLALQSKHIIFLSFNAPSDPVGEALLLSLPTNSQRFFPALPLHGITVYELGKPAK